MVRQYRVPVEIVLEAPDATTAARAAEALASIALEDRTHWRAGGVLVTFTVGEPVDFGSGEVYDDGELGGIVRAA